MTLTVTFNLTMLYLVAANVVAILVYWGVLNRRARLLEENTSKVTAAIIDYFKADGINVMVDCVLSPGNKSFLAFIESEPMKRFRYSHIVEISLRSHVWHVCGQEVERIFWRFPISGKGKEEEEAVREMEMPEEGEVKEEKPEKKKREEKHDEYIREGWEQLKELAGYDISEGSWEEFENTVTRRGGKLKPEQEAEGK